MTHPFLDTTGPAAIAHRGGAKEAPENTLEAFRAARDLGYRYLETDAQLTADGVVVAFHDRRIDRVSNQTGSIGQWQWEDLRDVPIGRGRLSTIQQLLDEFPTTCFNLDAKSDQVLEPLLDVIADAEALDRVCVGSFSERRLQRARSRFGHRLCTSFGPGAIARLVVSSRRGVDRPLGDGNVVQAPAVFRGIPVITPAFVDAAHEQGKRVHAWTIDDPAEMHRLLDLGIDGIMTDVPTTLRQVLEDRDQW